MADLVYNNFMRGLLSGEFDLGETGGSSDDIRIVLVMTNTDVDDSDERNSATFADFTTVAEFDGSGYTTVNSNGGIFTTERVTQDDSGSDQGGLFDAEDFTFSALGNGANKIQGCVIFKFVATPLTNGIPLIYIDSGFGTGIDPAGGDLTIAWNTLGILRLESPGQ